MGNCLRWCCFPGRQQADDDLHGPNTTARRTLSIISERDERNDDDDGIFRRTASNLHQREIRRRQRQRRRRVHALLPVLLVAVFASLLIYKLPPTEGFTVPSNGIVFHSSRKERPVFQNQQSLDPEIPLLATGAVETIVEGEPRHLPSHNHQHSSTSRGGESILSQYEQQKYELWNFSLTPIHRELHDLALEDPAKAEEAIQVMHESYAQNPENKSAIQPDATCYTVLMDGYIQAGKLREAQAVLDKMEAMAAADINPTNNMSPMAPTEFSYLLMVQAWANDYKQDFAGKSAEKAVAVLRRMQESARKRDPPSLRSRRRRESLNANNSTETSEATSTMVKAWGIVVEGWCKRAGIARQALKRAEEFLVEMEDNNRDAVVRPNVLTYTSFLGGLARCKDNNMAHKAEAVLDRMEIHNVQPDMVAYSAVINCWAKAVSPRERSMAATRALRILDDMERMYINKKNYLVKPSRITYAMVIAAIGNSLDPSAPQMAEDVLQRMYKLHESGKIANLKPDTATYNAVIYALSRAHRLRYAQRAEELLEQMTKRSDAGEKDITPDVRTWAAVLRAWTRSRQPDAAENAQRVLNKMTQRYKRGESLVRPNFVCYTTVMGAWGYSQRQDALDKMESILLQMEKSYEETLEADMRPNTVSYVTCIDAFVRRSEDDAAQRAQATVDRMMKLYAKGLDHVRPTRTVLNVLIHAWSRSKEKGAAKKAEKIFQWMESQYRAGDHLVRPDEVTLCAVLNAWANQAESGGAERAQQIWEHMESLCVEERGFRTTIAMPNIVIKAIARSKDPDAVTKAERILLRLEEDFQSGKSYLRPDVTTYSSVINACAYCVGNAKKRAEALDTALRTFKKLCNTEDEKANNITYGTVFKAIQNLMPVNEEREELVRELFDQCCEEGFIDHFVLSQVRFASPQLYRDLVEGPCGLGGPGAKYGIKDVLNNVPVEWSANVVA